MVGEGAVPGCFVAERAFYVGGSHVEVLAVEQVVGAFDHG